jgi:hypothetical protein
MEISYLLSFKNNSQVQELDSDFLERIKDLFQNYKNKSKKYRKYKNKKSNNILKNKKLQSAKNKIENKFNLILNKISNDNICELVKEFILTIGKITEEEYEVIQKTLYQKMLNEIKFIDNYLDFFIKINVIYYKKFNFVPDYLFKIIEEKIYFDYLNNSPKENFTFVTNLSTENERTNNIIILDKIIKKHILDEKISKFINSIIINQNIHIPDINIWFKNKTLSQSEEKKIQDKIDNLDLSFRNKVLLKNLLNEEEIIEEQILVDDSDKDTFIDDNLDDCINESFLLNEPFNLECKNIWDEFLYLGLPEEVKEFIVSDCKEAKDKNIFCEIGLDIYFRNNDAKKEQIFGLFKNLINKKVLYKSNLSRGLLLIYDVWDKISKDYNNKDTKLKIFLIFLKKNGITRGVEFLLKKFNMYYHKQNKNYNKHYNK